MLACPVFLFLFADCGGFHSAAVIRDDGDDDFKLHCKR